MPYHLLTGATGLLGNYLLRDLLFAGRPVAVVVRSSRMETARQRVESMLVSWERQWGRVLPRPPVLEGDICQPGMGLSAAASEWVAANCDCLIHNAASLSFEADEKTGEPHRSNVCGTQNVLEFCRSAGIRHFHHVSTAYVCGLRTGRILEDELDVGQELGNVYEQSKVEAEKLVRAATFLDKTTIYRPAIIIGDSVTGYSTTFHGFYTPLKILQVLADHFDVNQIDGAPMLAVMNMTGHERKNYVPVDWVSRVITWLSGRPEHHGRTYHLTPRKAVPMATTCAAIEQAMRAQIHLLKPLAASPVSFEDLAGSFIEQMETYRAYWRDDPDFDSRHTQEAAPHLPCPEVDVDMLVRTANFALQTNFGWPRLQPVHPEFDVLKHLSGQVSVGFENGHDPAQVQLIGMQINGPGGGQWTLAADGARPVAAQCGLASERHAMISMNSRTFRSLVRGELSVERAHEDGHLTIEGSQLSSREKGR